MGLFKKGYKVVREEKQRQDENKEKRKNKLYRFFLKNDKDEAVVRFLTEEPVTFYEHNIKTYVNGKEYYDNALCTGEDCKYCKNGEKAQFKGGFLIWDTREFEIKDGNKKKTVDGSLKLLVFGTKVLSQLDRISSKYGLTNREVTIVRLGKGTDTSYTIERGDKLSPLSKKEIENMMNDSLREIYNGTEDSLCDVIEASIEASGDSDYTNLSGGADEEDDEEYENNKNLIGDDDDDEEPPRKHSGSKPSLKSKGSSKKPMFKSKQVESSRKPSLKKFKR
jgi:hypothetical protein